MSTSPMDTTRTLTELRTAAMAFLAMSVLKLFPATLLGSGRVDEVGFYYDFVTSQPINEQALPLLESEMWGLIKSELTFKTIHMMRENAAMLFQHHGQTVKAALIAQQPDNILDILQIGNFYDLCPLPHPENGHHIGALKLERILPIMIQNERGIRIEGTAFSDKQQLKKFLKKAEQARKQDHQLLMPALKLASFQANVDEDLWFWYPKGVFLRRSLEALWREELQREGVQEICTSHLVSKNFSPEYLPFLAPKKGQGALLPSLVIGQSNYRLSVSLKARHVLFLKTQPVPLEEELPIRYAEWTTKCKDVTVDQLKGLLRTRTYTTDREHIFCTSGQLCQELISSLQIIDKRVKVFGFEVRWVLCPIKEKFSPSLREWERSVNELTKALSMLQIAYEVDETESHWEGPRIGVQLIDPLGRMWEGPYVGIDCYHPEVCGLCYCDAHNRQQPLAMISRSTFGSLERFIAVWIESCAGVLPFKSAPEQMRLLPIAARNRGYAAQIKAELSTRGYRVTIDTSDAALGSRVHKAEVEKIPYLLIIGDQEERKKTITIRGVIGQQLKESTMGVDEFLMHIRQFNEEI